jgi:hypothetical protein
MPPLAVICRGLKLPDGTVGKCLFIVIMILYVLNPFTDFMHN